MFQSPKVYIEDFFAKDIDQSKSNEEERKDKLDSSNEFFQLYNVHYQNHHTGK